jgi:hypothetical protein
MLSGICLYCAFPLKVGLAGGSARLTELFFSFSSLATLPSKVTITVKGANDPPHLFSPGFGPGQNTTA